jgi:hypothetical protein
MVFDLGTILYRFPKLLYLGISFPPKRERQDDISKKGMANFGSDVE